jgi:metal-responsive CopG/Arc/MetJ family transcriptional regulator
MTSVRINISLPKDVFTELSNEVRPRKRSQFITLAIKSLIKEKRNQRLAVEYQEASAEIKRINHKLEGAIRDGLN